MKLISYFKHYTVSAATISESKISNVYLLRLLSQYGMLLLFACLLSACKEEEPSLPIAKDSIKAGIIDATLYQFKVKPELQPQPIIEPACERADREAITKADP